jgi:hypothetical protein
MAEDDKTRRAAHAKNRDAHPVTPPPSNGPQLQGGFSATSPAPAKPHGKSAVVDGVEQAATDAARVGETGIAAVGEAEKGAAGVGHALQGNTTHPANEQGTGPAEGNATTFGPTVTVKTNAQGEHTTKVEPGKPKPQTLEGGAAEPPLPATPPASASGDTVKAINQGAAGATHNAAVAAAKASAAASTLQKQNAEYNTPYMQAISQADASGTATATSMLQGYGMSSSQISGLLGTLTPLFQSGASQAQITAAINQSPEFNARFPGLKEANAEGMGLTTTDYTNYENTLRGAAKSLGMDPGWAAGETGAYIASGTSAQDVVSRMEMAKGYIAGTGANGTAPSPISDAAKQYMAQNYGITEGDLAAYYMNPDTALDTLIQKQTSSVIGGGAATAGFGRLSTNAAQQLQEGGLTASQAETLFSTGQGSGGNPGTAQAAAQVANSSWGKSYGLTQDEAIGALAGIGVDGETSSQEQTKAGLANQATQNLFHGGGEFETTRRGTAVGSASEEGASGDLQGK